MKILLTAAMLTVIASAFANTATFDGFTEGFALSYTDNGVTVANLDRFLGDGPHDQFAIEEADGTLGGMTGFSSPNTLGFGGYSPGPTVAFTRFGTMDFSMASQGSSASMDIFAFANDANTSITLQGILGGNVVQSASVTLANSFVVSHSTLSLPNGTYDSFHIVSNSLTNQGASFVLFDNLTVTPVPEPATFGVVLAGCVWMRRRRRT